MCCRLSKDHTNGLVQKRCNSTVTFKTDFQGIEIPIIKIRRSHDRLIFIMVITMLFTGHLCSETAYYGFVFSPNPWVSLCLTLKWKGLHRHSVCNALIGYRTDYDYLSVSEVIDSYNMVGTDRGPNSWGEHEILKEISGEFSLHKIEKFKIIFHQQWECPSQAKKILILIEGPGVIYAWFMNFYMRDNFGFEKCLMRSRKSHSYLTGVNSLCAKFFLSFLHTDMP